ncbi:glycosyltransferase family 32 protein [Faecalibacter sp. LW9]|uniref:glycosyltransferase family 32 protein n=1 Tax=Faecalibacter sp. LW9 TaxID=3103144 RepID=UPI002AFDD963|nr:glycosyltransferase [Faecalibacter sp. LW9]
MIPKKIHYFWFGKGKKSELTEFCIESWRKNHPDFEIIEWTEDNFDVTSNIYIKQAYEQKKWAFVSDYARAKILYEEGGFYLDTDMEIKSPLHEFMDHRAICGFEIKGTPFSAFWAVEKGHPLAKDIKEYYENQTEFKEIPNTLIFSKLLVDKYGANASEDKFQELKEDIKLFPSHYFSLDLPKNYVAHHFSGSWHGAWTEETNSFKNYINTYGVVKMFTEIPQGKKEIKNLIYNHKQFHIDEILDQIPLSFILSYVKKNILKKIKRQ